MYKMLVKTAIRSGCLLSFDCPLWSKNYFVSVLKSKSIKAWKTAYNSNNIVISYHLAKEGYKKYLFKFQKEFK